MPPMVLGLKVVGGVVPAGGKSRPRLIMLTVLLPVFVTTAAPVASLMATPVGFVPTVTSAVSGETGGFFVKSITEAVLLPWVATTARPLCCQRAMPWGVVPTETGGPINLPKLGFGWGAPRTVTVGVRSIVNMLLQPVTLTSARGEKGPFAIWSAIATDDGCVLVGFPLESVHTVDRATDWMTRKSTALDCTPLPVTRSSA